MTCKIMVRIKTYKIPIYGRMITGHFKSPDEKQKRHQRPKKGEVAIQVIHFLKTETFDIPPLELIYIQIQPCSLMKFIKRT